MSFAIRKTIDLADFGWEGCSLVFKSLNYNELQVLQGKYSKIDPSKADEAAREILNLLASKFVSGTALDENDKKVEISADQLGELPFEIVEKISEALTRSAPDPKS